MVFSSILFLLYFLPVFMLVYVLLPKSWKNHWALLVSILFYAWGAPNFIYVVLATSLLDFYLVRAIYNAENQSRKKLFLSTSLVLNLGLLAYFKYANFFIENVNLALGELGMASLHWTSVALPIGISFFTFQTLTYAIEVYRQDHAPFEKPTQYLLYKLIFPHAIAGPIIRFKSVAQQVAARTETPDDRISGLFRFSIGLAKKVL
ncbi:MAG: MBOAT family protein, partial [Flavobacteriia bacterium]